MPLEPRLRPLAVFTLAYLAIALAAGLRSGNSEFLFYIAVMVVLIGLVLAVNRSIELSTGALWALSIWGLMHMAGGLVTVPTGWPVNAESRVLYSLWLIPERLKYDHIVPGRDGAACNKVHMTVLVKIACRNGLEMP